MGRVPRAYSRSVWQPVAICRPNRSASSRLRSTVVLATLSILSVMLGASAARDLHADELKTKEATPAPKPSPPAASTAIRYSNEWLERLDRSAIDIQNWANRTAWQDILDNPERALENFEQLFVAKEKSDSRLQAMFDERTRFASLPATDERRRDIRGYLTATSRMIELSGHLRYALHDALNNATYDLVEPVHLDRMIDMIVRHRSQIGADTLKYSLFDPPADSGVEPFPVALKVKILRLMADVRSAESLEELGEFTATPSVPPDLLVQAADTIRQIGLPQDVRPNQEPELPLPAVTASQLHDRLSALNPAKLSADARAKRTELLTWLDQRRKKGVVESKLRVAGIDVAPGDWLLMRNPSPYNRFTDHSPGLFTHVGIVAEERDADGRRRLVIVDLPERGANIPATNVDVFLQRTLHYVFLRHRDPQVARGIATAAAAVIGNPSQFDLQFRSDRVREMHGKPLAGATIHTYCAGLLMLCAQETQRPISAFFPIVEQPAGGRCAQNLAQLGLSIGKDFVSPTGALFSPELEIVGRCEPMYEPSREVQEYVFDAFAAGMIERQLSPTPNAYQALRERVATMSKRNRALARALARANNVNENQDLESAAKAAAVVETLDEIAEAASAAFEKARTELTGPADNLLVDSGYTPEEIAETRKIRQKHQKLYDDYQAKKLNRAQLREALVEYYGRQGVQQLNERFFK